MKRFLAFLLTLIICFSFPFSVSATTITDNDRSSDTELLREQLNEITSYLATNTEPVEIKSQTLEYDIPLSDGTTAHYSFSLIPATNNSRTIFEAVLGTWYFKSTLELPLHGSFTVQTTVYIYHVPTEEYDLIRFKAYDGTVSAIPLQYTSISGSSATTSMVYNDIWYETTGYVGFMCGDIVANIYYTQEITFVNNTDQNTKIYCGLSYEM